MLIAIHLLNSFLTVNQVKEKAPSAIPGGFLHLRNKFHETFMAIYTADSVPTVQL